MRISGLNFSSLTFRVVRRHWLVWLKTWPSALAWAVGEPLIFLAAFGLGLRKFIPSVEGVDYAVFIAPGLVAAGAMEVACYECTFGSYSRLEMIRAYDAISSTPVMPEEIALADALWGALKACIMAVVMTAIFALFHTIKSPLIILSLPAVFFMSLFFAGLSLIVTSFASGYDFFSYYFSALITPAFFFSGAFFPVDSLPPVLQVISRAIPVTYAVETARLSSMGRVSGELVWNTLILAGYAVPAVLIACWRMKRRIVK